jgi:hypothetical protein
MQNQQQNQRPMGDSLQFVLLLFNAHAICLTPFLHRGFGVRYPGTTGLAAAVLIFAMMGITHDPLLWMFFWAWAVAMVAQRAYAVKLRRAGVAIHSFYDGYPWLAMKLGMKSDRTARMGEGIWCLLVGGVLAAAGTRGLGQFIMFGCMSLPVVEAMKRQMRHKQVLSAQDALLEMQAYQERIQGSRDDF